MERNFTMENNTTAEQTAPESSAANDLQSYFAQSTAKKQPGSSNTSAPKNSFWDASDSDFDIPVSKTNEKTIGVNPPQTPTNSDQSTDSQPKKITEQTKRGSANAAAGMVDFSTRLLLTPIHTYKLKKKIEKNFTDAQLNLIDSKLAESDESKLDAEELRIKRRFDSIMNKYQQKIDKLPMSESEKKEQADAFYNYFDYTNKTLSPDWYLYMSLINSVGGRVVDVFTE